MITWFEDLEVTRFLKLRYPPSIEAEKEWLEKIAKDPDHIQWVVEFKGEAADGSLSGAFKSSGLRPYFLPRAAYYGLDKVLMEAMT